MSSLEDTLAELASGSLPGAVFLAADESGKFHYNRAVGVRSTKPENKHLPLDADTVLKLASCTKLFTGIAAMQCVERGLLALDDDVTTLLPELAPIEILEGFDEKTDQPLFKPRTKPITLRTLLSHTSGFGYELVNPLLRKWRSQQGGISWSGATIPERCTFPLMFDPGSAWLYGNGADWAGKLIERATNLTLEEYIGQHISRPLDLRTVSFWPDTKPDLSHRIADVSMPGPEGVAVPLEGFDFINGLKDCLGGGGIYGSASDMLTLLQAVLHRDAKLLKPESWEELVADQLSEDARTGLFNLLRDDETAEVNYSMNVPRDGRKSWSLAGLLSLDEYDGWMGKNTLLWGGMTGIAWFVDHERGLCGLTAAQLMFGDRAIYELQGIWLHEVYRLFNESKQAK